MSSLPQVIVVGSVMQDLTLACTEFPAAGQTVMARMRVGQGGKGSNQAIACGRLGVPTLFIGAVGRDPFARKVRTYYRRERIACRLIEKNSEATGTAIVMINSHGQNQIVIEPGANARLQPADIPAPAINGARVVLAQLESGLRATAHALKTARAAGVTTVLNPAPMLDNFPMAMLRHVDILVPNETEFVALVRRAHPGRRFDEQRLHRMPTGRLHALCRSLKVPTVIITLGGKGCFISDASGHRLLPAHNGMKVVDTTGAGDAFCGGLAAGLVRFDGDVAAAARLGGAIAALSITKAGAADSMPSKATVDRFCAKTPVLGEAGLPAHCL